MGMTMTTSLLLRRLRTLGNEICFAIVDALRRNQAPMRVVELQKAIEAKESTTSEALRRLHAVHVVEMQQDHRYSLCDSGQLNALLDAIPQDKAG